MDKIIINSYIDHTILKPESTYDQIIQICEEAKKYQFASVCVNSGFASLVSKQLKGSDVKTGIVIGFPLGVCSTETKVCEVKDVINNGAQEVDMVINVGALKSGDLDCVEKDIATIIVAANKIVLVKVILETCLLTKDEIVTACKIAKKAGADFVKTSTGFNAAGATVEHIKLMRQTVGDKMGIKASGGIKTLQTVLDMIKAGATRIGCSSSVKIMQELEEKEM
jgi:deoxyribose-phosphate aldolase